MVRDTDTKEEACSALEQREGLLGQDLPSYASNLQKEKV